MRVPATLVPATLAAIALMTAMPSLTATPALAQQFTAPTPQGPSTAAKLGQLEVKAYSTIPKTKTAVQLTSDTALARNVRREVMVRLARRGNEVGFSGGNVMRLDVSFFDLSSGGPGTPGTYDPTINPQAAPYGGPGDNPRPNGVTGLTLGPRDATGRPSTGPTIRLNLTLYSTDGGKVLWSATASCGTQASMAEAAGIAMVNAIFDDADKNRIADAGCPL